MERLQHLFGISLPHSVKAKIRLSDLFPLVSPITQSPWYQRDSFYPDGFPKVYDATMIYPCYAAWYLGYPIPQTHLDMKPEYSRAAAYAAVDWLTKVLPNAECDMRHNDGEILQLDIKGNHYSFCFPTTMLTYSEDGIEDRIAVIPYPDSRENEEDWESAVVPSYVEAQALLTLWCWRYSYLLKHRIDFPTKAMVVCVTGNTAGDTQASSDVKVRTIEGNPAKEEALVSRICHVWTRAVNQSVDPRDNRKVRAQTTWLEQKEAEQAEAYQIDDPDIHALISQYMQLRSQRKTLDDKEKEIKEEMDTIAVALASMMVEDAEKGTVSDGSFSYTVRHVPKAYKNPSVTADLVAQYYPQYMDCVTHHSIAKGRVTVEAI